ncbi:diguanylate cyclase [Silanimonas sp.]|jgi:diguanylate cyclase (GGDEF)-like protein|uniref:diguanylate cyclase n=1 Tax=Silanimonas sp. TaxID=1929290 RepID=UPI0037C8963B
MNRWAGLLLGIALFIGGALARADERPVDGIDSALQAEMDRLFALRTVDPQAFVAQTRSLDTMPPPANLGQREFLQFLQANRAAFEGRLAEAAERAKPLADAAGDPRLRLRAGAFVINMLAGTRDFEEGLRRLTLLLRAHPMPDPALLDEQRVLWATAAVLYNELGQHAMSVEYADRALSAGPTPREACGMKTYKTMARLSLRDASLAEADFDAADAVCRAARETVFGQGFLSLSLARFLRDRGRSDEALRLLEDRIGQIESTRYPRLVAEAYALDAELLLAAGRIPEAERQAQQAIETSKDTPTSLPVAMAEKVLFEIHRQRGDSSAALRHLHRHVAANRALAEESLTKERAFRTVQHESLQREQQLALATERNRVLDLEATIAKAESRNAAALSAALLLTVAGLVFWGWRLWADAQRFRELAQTDPLTGLATRQHFAELAAAALERGRADGRPLALVAFDLDQFKAVNDRHGHRAGDAVLRTISAAVRAVPAPWPCIIGRIGGEEFAVLLDGATEAQAATYAEALRRAIASAEEVVEGGRAVTVTASFGLSGTHEAGHDLQSLLDLSDRALYRAKNGGRDRVAAVDAA